MTWFAAHVVTCIDGQDENGRVTVFENIYLVEGSSDDEALKRANKIGAAEEFEDNTLTVDGRPTFVRFVGVRKMVRISNEPPLDQDQDRPVSGSEVSYLRYEVETEKLSDLISNRLSEITLIE